MGSAILGILGLPSRTPASSAEIALAEERLGAVLPGDYREFLRLSNGIEGFVGPDQYVILWKASEVADLNDSYASKEFAPGLLLLGTDGGDTGYGVLGAAGSGGYVRVPLVGMSLDASEPMGTTLAEFVQRLRAGGGSPLPRAVP